MRPTKDYMMTMFKKMSLLALAMCAASTATHAEEKSWGAVTAKIIVEAGQAWQIEKISDGKYMTIGGKYMGSTPSEAAGGNSPQFKISNFTKTASKYFIAGSGASASEDGTIYVINDTDANKKFRVKPRTSAQQVFDWDAEVKKYRSISEVPADGSEVFDVVPTGNTWGADTFEPGNYTVSIELFVPVA